MAQINISRRNSKIISIQNSDKGSSICVTSGNEIKIHNDDEIITVLDGTCTKCKTNNYVLYEDKDGVRYFECIKCGKKWSEKL